MKRVSHLVIIFISLLAFLSCSQTSNVDLENQGEVSMISFIDEGCIDLVKTSIPRIEGEDALNAWSYKDGVLNLEFQFNAICGCLFEEEINITGSIIEIVLTDTAVDHARCNCDYKEVFSFSVEKTSQAQIIFVVKFYPDFEKIIMVDKILKW